MLIDKLFIAAESSLFISHLHIMAITDSLHDVLAKRIADLFEKTFRHIHRAKKAECSNMQMRV
ncbi:MAG: hypothetical protein KBT27_00950 [Prevotellaceae bacterium]|nr:hypothetical protein [Candidatus Faecinaster equi]